MKIIIWNGSKVKVQKEGIKAELYPYNSPLRNLFPESPHDGNCFLFQFIPICLFLAVHPTSVFDCVVMQVSIALFSNRLHLWNLYHVPTILCYLFHPIQQLTSLFSCDFTLVFLLTSLYVILSKIVTQPTLVSGEAGNCLFSFSTSVVKATKKKESGGGEYMGIDICNI